MIRNKMIQMSAEIIASLSIMEYLCKLAVHHFRPDKQTIHQIRPLKPMERQKSILDSEIKINTCTICTLQYLEIIGNTCI